MAAATTTTIIRRAAVAVPPQSTLVAAAQRKKLHDEEEDKKKKKKQEAASGKSHDHLCANTIIRHTVLSAGSVLAAFTLRDFMQSVMAKVVDHRASIVINFFYTLLIFLLVIWIAYIWQ